MRSEREVDYSRYFNLPNPGLTAYFASTEHGNDVIYCTPWIMRGNDKLSNQEKLNRCAKFFDEWIPHLDKIKKEWPDLYKYEMEMYEKVGPYSVQKPLKQRMEDIYHYYDDVSLKSEPVEDKAIQYVLKSLSAARNTQIRSEQKTWDNMTKSTNSGSPYFTKRCLVARKTLPVMISGDTMLLDSARTEWKYCAILGWRGQEGGFDVDSVKQRVVWMFPMAVNIRELQAYQPLITVFQNYNYVPAWVSMEAVDQTITQMFDTKGDSDVVICTDFSKFDQHFNPHMQNAAKTIISGLLRDDGMSRSWLDNIFPIKYNIPLALGQNRMIFGAHGMGSGSGGTNFDETCSHKALQAEVAIDRKSKLNPYSQCLGDDGILTYPGIKVDDVIRSYTKHGQEMNPDKQYVSKQDCVYLRRWHHAKYRVNGVCVGVYPTVRALNRLLMQERYYDPEDWGPKMVALRELSIIENCKYHPLREEFADLCMKWDKYRLGIDIPGFLDQIDDEAKKAIEYMPDFLGYTKSYVRDKTGLSDWWIVKYLKSKR